MKHDDTGLESLAGEPSRGCARARAAARAVLLVAVLTPAVGCSLSTPIPNARLACEGDWQCPTGYVCQAKASRKVCCLPGTCAGEAAGRPPGALEPTAVDTPDAAPADGPAPVPGPVADSAALAPEAEAPTDAAASAMDVSPDAPPLADAAAPTLEEACTEWARVFCAHLNACAPESLQDLYGGSEVCVARKLITCKHENAPISGAHLDAAFVIRCARAMDSPGAPCAEFLVRGNLLPECNPPPGDLRNGSVCSHYAQCQSLTCNYSSQCGVCDPPPTIGGDDCQSSNYCLEVPGHLVTCAPDLRCVVDGVLNDSCDHEHPCDETAFFCGAGGHCEPLRRAGAPCDGPDQCDVRAGFACAPAAPPAKGKACQPIVHVAVGGDCRGPLAHCTDGWCNQAGKCARFAADGQPCPSNTDAECQDPATCTDGRCTLPVRPVCGPPTP